MKTYIYKGTDNFFYRDKCIAQLGDSLEFDKEGIRNISNKNTYYKIPSNVCEEIFKECEEVNLTDDYIDFNEFSDIKEFIKINNDSINKLVSLGILKIEGDNCRNYNIGNSNYSTHVIQPWTIWQDYNLNPWDADIIKRVLRTKIENSMSENDSRIMDYEKIIHICKERIRQLKNN